LRVRFGRDEWILAFVLGACAAIWLAVQFLKWEFKRNFQDWP